MRIDLDTVKGFVSQRLGDEPEKIAEVFYQCYHRDADVHNETIRKSFREIESCVAQLPYLQADRICTATVNACVECEKLAFLDGVAVGARLILELTGQ